MNLEKLNVQEMNTVEKKSINGGRSVQTGEYLGGAFAEPRQKIGDVAWWYDGWNGYWW